MNTMTAVIFDGKQMTIESRPFPPLRPGWAKIKVRLAGICKTDMEILKGYKDFRGVPGHEFVGVVEACTDTRWIGKRVVGEINAACGNCCWCQRGLQRHCPDRLTLGIDGLDGCMAEYCQLPPENLLAVPDDLSDERACLIEPLAAACEILEQRPVENRERVIVLGDGKLGILCAWVLSTVSADVTLIGHSAKKLDIARWRGIKTLLSQDKATSQADLVVEATGSVSGVAEAMSLCRPRGTIVLKSTMAMPQSINLTSLVVNEQTLLGSRCGRFTDGLKLLRDFPDMPLEKLLTARYPLARAPEAFGQAKQKNTLKVLLDISS